MVSKFKKIMPGVLLSVGVSMLSIFLSTYILNDLIGSTVMALLVGMVFHGLLQRSDLFNEGVLFTTKVVLRMGIILMGVNLNISEVVNVGKFSLVLMIFTMVTAFGIGNILGKVFGIHWKLTNLLSVSTAICGGSAVAAVGPVIKAKNEDITYAISATFIFDIITVIIFPWIGLLLGMSNMGYGLWIGTSVNDTSSVVAAGYAFSHLAGNTAVIVKLTRTLFIIPYVLIFSIINERLEAKTNGHETRTPVNLKKIFPYFILLFLLVVLLRSTGVIPDIMVSGISSVSKFCMIMALSAIGLSTSFKDLKNIGPKPMILGFVVDTLVVIVSMGVLLLMGKF